MASYNTSPSTKAHSYNRINNNNNNNNNNNKTLDKKSHRLYILRKLTLLFTFMLLRLQDGTQHTETHCSLTLTNPVVIIRNNGHHGIRASLCHWFV